MRLRLRIRRAFSRLVCSIVGHKRSRWECLRCFQVISIYGNVITHLPHCEEHDVAVSVCMTWAHIWPEGHIKIWELNEYEWWMGVDVEEIIDASMKMTGCDREETTGGEDPRELSGEDLDRLMFRDEDGTKRTFREELVDRLKAGVKGPTFFAGTEC